MLNRHRARDFTMGKLTCSDSTTLTGFGLHQQSAMLTGRDRSDRITRMWWGVFALCIVACFFDLTQFSVAVNYLYAFHISWSVFGPIFVLLFVLFLSKRSHDILIGSKRHILAANYDIFLYVAWMILVTLVKGWLVGRSLALVLGTGGAYLLLDHMFSSQESREQVLQRLLWMIMVIALGFMSLSFIFEPIRSWKVDYYGIARGYGGLGMIALAATGSGVALLPLIAHKGRLTFIYLTIGLSLVQIACSVSRTAYLAAGMILLNYIFRAKPHRFLLLVFVFLIVVGLFGRPLTEFTLGLQYRLLNRYSDILWEFGTMEAGRLVLWPRRIADVLGNPFFGPLGWRGTSVASGGHNIFLDIGLYYGLPGFVLYVLILFRSGAKALRNGSPVFRRLLLALLVLALPQMLFLSSTNYVRSPVFWESAILIVAPRTYGGQNNRV